MAKNNSNKNIRIGNVFTSPVFTGSDGKYIWTSLVKADSIDEFLVPDPIVRERLRNLTRRYENMIHTIRRQDVKDRFKSSIGTLKNISSIAGAHDNDPLEDVYQQADQITSFVTDPKNGILIDLYCLYLIRDYDEIKENNPKEIDAIAQDAKNEIKLLTNHILNMPVTVVSGYSLEDDRYKLQPILIKAQEDRLKIEETHEKLLDAIHLFTGDRKDVSVREGMEVLKLLSSYISVSDLVYIVKDPDMAKKIIDQLYENYVLDRRTDGLIDEQIEDEGKDLSEIDMRAIREKAVAIVDELDEDRIIDEAIDTYNSLDNEEHSEYVANAIVDNAKFVDINKLLLIVAANALRAIDGLRLEKIEDSESLVSKQLKEANDKVQSDEGEHHQMAFDFEGFKIKMKQVRELCQKLLDSGMMARKASLPKEFEAFNDDYTLKYVNDLMKNFVGDIYLSELVEKNLVFEAYSHTDVGVSDWSYELIKKMNLDDNIFVTLSLSNLDNLLRFNEAGIVDERRLDLLISEARKDTLEEEILAHTGKGHPRNLEMAKLMTENAGKVLSVLYGNDIINEDKLLELYFDGTLKFEELESLSEEKYGENIKEFNDKMSLIFTRRGMLERYKELTEAKIKLRDLELLEDRTDEQNKEIEELKEQVNTLTINKDRFLKGFKKFTYEPQMAQGMLEEYYLDMEVGDNEELVQESIKAFYEDRLVNVSDIVTLDSEYVIPMIDKLSLEDSRKMRESMTFEETRRLLDNIFLREDFSEEQKYVIMMNLLCMRTKEDRDAIKEYRKLLSISNNEKRRRSTKRRGEGDGTSYDDFNKQVYPDDVKWETFRTLDKDATITRYANGFVEINSSKIPYRIIERYYEKNGRYAYGTATYFVHDDVYNANVADLISHNPDGDVLEPTVLREIVPRGQDRVPHITRGNLEEGGRLSKHAWMRTIAERMGYDFNRRSQYYDEELVAKLTELSRQSIPVDREED